MAEHSLSAILRKLGRRAATDGPGALGDADLLRRYAEERDAAAFELIVWRHGATVWGVCRRSLTRLHDAEDAFQAVFFVLARKAASVRSGDCLGGWLHRVAVRVARRAQARAIRSNERERPSEAPEIMVNDDRAEWSDLGPAVDEEIDRLPARYRSAFVLCHLQGYSCEEAARRLGCARGTILSRLARARDRLKDRLTRRGITLSSAAFASLAGGTMSAAARAEATACAAIASASKSIAAGVSSSAVLLSQEVMRTMFVGKLKALACATVLLLGLGAFGWSEFVPGIHGGHTIGVACAQDRDDGSKAPSDADKLQGKWKMLYTEQAGRKDDDVMALIFEKDTLKLQKDDRITDNWTFKLDPSAKPKWIDVVERDKVMKGIYELDGDNLKICLREKGDERPTRFESDNARVVVMVLKRETKATNNRDNPVEDLKRENQRLLAELQKQLERARAAEQEARAQRDLAEKARLVSEVARLEAERARKLAEVALQAADEQRVKAENQLADIRKQLEAALKEIERLKIEKK